MSAIWITCHKIAFARNEYTMCVCERAQFYIVISHVCIEESQEWSMCVAWIAQTCTEWNVCHCSIVTLLLAEIQCLIANNASKCPQYLARKFNFLGISLRTYSRATSASIDKTLAWKARFIKKTRGGSMQKFLKSNMKRNALPESTLFNCIIFDRRARTLKRETFKWSCLFYELHT